MREGHWVASSSTRATSDSRVGRDGCTLGGARALLLLFAGQSFLRSRRRRQWRARHDPNARPPGPQPGGSPAHPGHDSARPAPPRRALEEPAEPRVRRHCYTVAVRVAVRGGGGRGSQVRMDHRGSPPRRSPSSRVRCQPIVGSGWMSARDKPSGSRARGLPRAHRVAPSERRPEKPNNGGEFRVFDRDNGPGRAST